MAEKKEKITCGYCKHFMLPSSNTGADDGYCNAIIMEDGIGKEVNINDNASKCPHFLRIDRIRTNTSEFMWDPSVRVHAEFEEE